MLGKLEIDLLCVKPLRFVKLLSRQHCLAYSNENGYSVIPFSIMFLSFRICPEENFNVLILAIPPFLKKRKKILTSVPFESKVFS